MNRIPSLDGVRAIAISLVVMGHWAEVRFQSDVAGSFASLGRRIFFVLSGYLITTLLMKEYGKSRTIRLRKFYMRRAYRILPAAFLLDGASVCDFLARSALVSHGSGCALCGEF